LGLGGQLFNEGAARHAIQAVAQALREAMRHARPVTHVGLGRAKVAEVASNRRVLGPDGKVRYVRYSSCKDPKIRAEPEGVIDPWVRLISLWDEERPLAVLSYYATHPQSYYCQGGVSADFVGMARSLREKALPGVFHLHFNGASGNVAAGKYNDGSPEMRPILAQRLAVGMAAAWDATVKSPIRPSEVGWRILPVELPLASALRDEPALEKVMNDPGAKPAARREAARGLAWVRRPRTDLARLCLGSARVLYLPGELFVEYQLAASQMKPDAFIAVAAYGEYGPGYIGTKIAYSQGGYETGPASRTSPDVEDVLTKAIQKLVE
jgi:hypothetical protein